MAGNGFYTKILVSLQKPSNVWKFIGIISILKLIYIYFIPITPQEAYYWYYSLFPALSYFDHPPMAAYSIWIGTHIFGDTVFGVKFMAVVWGLLTNIFLYLTLKKATSFLDIDTPSILQQIPFMGIILYNLTIFSHLYSITIMPDTPLIFFWIATIYFVVRVKADNQPVNWIYAGICVGLGMLSKYTMAAILPAIFLAMLLDSALRSWFKTAYPYLAIVIAAIIFLPVIIWNYQHEWASFAFQFGERAGRVRKFRSKYVIQLLISQLFLLTPFIFFIFGKLMKRIISVWNKQPVIRLLFISGAILIFTFIAYSMFSLVKMNWLLPAYTGWIAGATLLFYYLFYTRSFWLKLGLYSSIWLILIAYSLLLIPNIPLGEGNTWSGWKDAAGQIHQLYQKYGGGKKMFLFTNSYKSSSLLKFYLPDQQIPVYSRNIYKQPALQFDYWPLPDSLKGKNALYIFTDRKEYKNDLEKISPYFRQLVPLKELKYQFMDQIHTRSIFIYLAKGYKPDGY